MLAGTALIAALIAAVFLTFASAYSGETCTVTSGGVRDCTQSSSTLIDVNGERVISVLAIPVVLAASGLLVVRYRLPTVFEWSIASACFSACIVAILSIGIFFLPVAALLFAAAIADRRQPVSS